MRKRTIENRRYNRVLFTAEDGIIGRIAPENDKSLNVIIMNLSVGGMHGIVTKADANHIGVGEIIRLDGITGAVNFHLPRGVGMEIKWIMDAELFDHAGLGCEFLDLPESIEGRINRFVDAERASRGQYN